MKYKKLNIFISSLMISSIFITSVFAESLSELEDKSTQIENDINASKNQIDEKQNNLDKVNADILQLDKELEKSVNELNTINTELNDVTTQLDDANDRLIEATLEKNEQQQTLEKRVRYMYEYGEVSYLNTLLGSNSFIDFLNRIEYLNRISEYDHNLYAQLEAKELEIDTLVDTIETKSEKQQKDIKTNKKHRKMK